MWQLFSQMDFRGPDAGFSPTCTVLICTRDRPAQLDRCLEAVARLHYREFNTLVVDNAPNDSRAREVADRRHVRYVVAPVPGANRARNLGVRLCDSDVVAFLDDDAVPEPDWLAGLAVEFQDPQVMAVTGRIIAPRPETEAERLSIAMRGAEFGGPERLVFDRQTPSWFELANFGGIGIGANMAFRRSVFRTWPGFDERIDRGTPAIDGHVENYAFFSLIDCGHKIVYTPRAVVRHPHPKSREELRARYLKDLANASGYMTLLWFEQPAYRSAVWKYAIEAARGKRRTWRRWVEPERPGIVPRYRALLAVLSGPLLYAKLRWTAAGSGGPEREAPSSSEGSVHRCL